MLEAIKRGLKANDGISGFAWARCNDLMHSNVAI